MHVAFSPDGRLLAVGYERRAVVDVLDSQSLDRVLTLSPTNVRVDQPGLWQVAWSRDGQTLFAAGDPRDDAGRFVLFAWDNAGRGPERRLSYCAETTLSGLGVLPGGQFVVASMGPSLCLMSPEGQSVWTVPSPVGDFRAPGKNLRISADGKVVDFGFGDAAKSELRFDVRSLRLSDEASKDGLTLAPRHGLAGFSIDHFDIVRSLAFRQDGEFFVGSTFGLTAFDSRSAIRWRRPSRSEVWSVNASRDGRIVVAAYGDGTIRWHRADNGSELLVLQVLANKNDWVLWTPEGFYEATPGAQDVLKWMTNNGPDKPATTRPVSAIAKLHRPNALPMF